MKARYWFGLLMGFGLFAASGAYAQNCENTYAGANKLVRRVMKTSIGGAWYASNPAFQYDITVYNAGGLLGVIGVDKKTKERKVFNATVCETGSFQVTFSPGNLVITKSNRGYVGNFQGKTAMLVRGRR